MEEEKVGADKFMSIDKFITELIGYHEQIKKLQASESYYKHLSGILQESLNRHQTLFNHLPQKVFLKDKNLFYVLANEKYARTLGIAPQDIIGKTDHDFFPFEAAEQRLNDDRRFLGEGRPEEKEERHTRNGGVGVERIVKIPVQNESGEIAGILGMSWDVTERKEKEEELERRNKELAGLLEARNAEWKEIQERLQREQAERRALEEKLRSLEGYYGILFENTGTAIAVIEDNRVISRINTEFENFLGYPRAEVEGAKNWNECIQNGCSQNRAESAGSPDTISLDPGTRVFSFLDRQNRGKTVSMTAARIPDTNKVLVSLKDVTKYTRAREELNRTLKQFMELMVEMERGVKNLEE